MTFFSAFLGQSVFLAELVAHDPRTRCDSVHAWLQLSDKSGMCLTAARRRILGKMFPHTTSVEVCSASYPTCAPTFSISLPECNTIYVYLARMYIPGHLIIFNLHLITAYIYIQTHTNKTHIKYTMLLCTEL
jgi:hypothetical protein